MEVSKTYEDGIQSVVTGALDFSQVGPVSYVDIKVVSVQRSRGGDEDFCSTRKAVKENHRFTP